jgi:aryl-alcohol dehydrogenase-like predicted oxidoreductase
MTLPSVRARLRGTCAIVGASRPEQLEESLGVRMALEPEEPRVLDEVWWRLPRERDPRLARR